LEDLGTFNLDGIAWAIVGGESGPGARPMKPEWVHNIRRQCKKARVAFFFKQWGGVRKSETGRELDGKTYSEFPARSSIDAPSLENRRSVLRQLEADLVVA
jgi:protein gp37